MSARAPTLSAPRRVWLTLALLAVLAMQSLALVHALSHGHGRAVAMAAEAGGGSAQPWGHALGSLACEQLDQLAHGTAPLSCPPALGALAIGQAAPAALPVTDTRAAPWRRYLARAPPRG